MSRVIVLLRKNIVAQAISMIRAVQLSSSPDCGSNGWNRVKQPGWDTLCGPTYEAIQKSNISITDLKQNLDDIKDKTRDIVQVISMKCII